VLIFDGFAFREKAEEYATWVTEKYQRSATVYDTQEQSDAVDPFPFRLFPPIVLVERIEIGDEQEQQIEEAVQDFDGRFAGT
jgi:hypothetical protein